MPTTNQVSRAPNRNIRASDSRFTRGSVENTWANFAAFEPFGSPAGMNSTTASRIAARITAIRITLALNPMRPSRAAPRKKPKPFTAFLDPVSTATQRNSAPSPSGASSFTADFDDILARSLATPDSPCTAITKGTDSAIAQLGSSRDRAKSATICSVRPA